MSIYAIKEELFIERDTIFAIIDLSHDEYLEDPIGERLKKAPIKKVCVYDKENVQNYAEYGPWLVELNRNDKFSNWLIENSLGNAWCIFLHSEMAFDDIARHFRQFVYLTIDGKKQYFRYYDPINLSVFLNLCDEKTRNIFMGPISSFVAETVLEDGRVKLNHFHSESLLDYEMLAPGEYLSLNEEQKKAFGILGQKQREKDFCDLFVSKGFNVKQDSSSKIIKVSDKTGASTLIEPIVKGFIVTSPLRRSFGYHYDDKKNISKITDPAKSELKMQYTEEDKLSSIHFNDQLKAKFIYEDSEDLRESYMSVEAPDGAREKFTYERDDYLVEHENKNGDKTKWDREYFLGLATSRTDVRNNTTKFEYDNFQAPSTILNPDNSKFEFEYNTDFFKQGLMTRFLINGKEHGKYEIDDFVFKAHFHDNTKVEIETDSDESIKLVNNFITKVKFDYDDEKNVVAEEVNGKTIKYHRDAVGRLIGITTPSNEKIEYVRDLDGRIVKIIDRDNNNYVISWHINGALKSISFPNGVVQEWEVDAEGVSKSNYVFKKDEKLFYEKYERDLCQRVTKVSDETKVRNEFGYDPEGRLTKSNNISFNLDESGNKISEENGYESQYDSMNRLKSYIGKECSYDDMGNTLQCMTSEGMASLKYNGQNKLIESVINAQVVEYKYDGLGRRLSKDNGITKTTYTWAGLILLSEEVFDYFSNKIIERYDYLMFPDTALPISVKQKSAYGYFHHDYRWEPILVTNDEAVSVWSASYTSFGKLIHEKGNFYQPFRLPGQYYDAETGLHYAMSRYYHPGMGRYLSCDPLCSEGGSDNYYTYCDGDPINKADPTGEFIICAILIGAAIGAAIGGISDCIKQNHEIAQNKEQSYSALRTVKQACIGGLIGAAGAVTGAAIATVATAAFGAATTIAGTMAVGFAEGVGTAYVADCITYRIKGTKPDPWEIAWDMAVGGVIGGLTAGIGAWLMPKGANAAVKAIEKDTLDDLGTEAVKKGVKKVAGAGSKIKARIGNGGRGNQNQKPKLTKDPVNAVTGEVILDKSDFVTPGYMPFEWTRHYGSLNKYAGVCGYGWSTPADIRIEKKEDGKVIFYAADTTESVFDSLPTDKYAIIDPATGLEISFKEENENTYISVWDPSEDKSYSFDGDKDFDIIMISKIRDRNDNSIEFLRNSKEVLEEIRLGKDGHSIVIGTSNHRIVSMNYRPLFNKRPVKLVRYKYNLSFSAKKDREAVLIEAADQKGNAHKYFYDTNYRMIRHTDKNALSFNYSYEKEIPFRCIQTWGDGNLYFGKFEYGDGVTTVVNKDNSKTIFKYNEDFFLTKKIDPENNTTSFEYDRNGKIIALVDPENNKTEYAYTDSAQVDSILRPDGSKIDFEYDEFSRLLSITDPAGGIWNQEWDNRGNLIAQITPDGHKTEYFYNDHGVIEKIVDPMGAKTSFLSNDVGNITKITDAENRITEYKFDDFANPLAIINPAGLVTSYLWDSKNRLKQIKNPSGSEINCQYDPEDNLIVYENENGEITRFEYTGLGEISKRINADESVVKYKYDTEENLISVLNEKGEEISFTRDSQGRILSESDYWGAKRKYKYSPAGNLLEAVDPKNRITSFFYDSLGQIKEKLFADGTRENYKFDLNGNLIFHDNGKVAVNRRFDAQNYLTREQINEITIDNTYDASGRRIKRETSNDNSVIYQYNKVGEATAVIINDKEPIKINHNSLGLRESELFKSHVRKYEYNEEGFLTKQVFNFNFHKTGQRDFYYDPVGNLLQKTDSNKGKTYFQYNPVDKVVFFNSPEKKLEEVLYDPAGNLLRRKIIEHEDESRTELIGERDYKFDIIGNLIERKDEHGISDKFKWDQSGNLIRYNRGIIEDTVLMNYDCQGRRVDKIVNKVKTTFGWDGDALLCEHDGNKFIREYVYYPDSFEPLAMIGSKGDLFLYQNDQTGAPNEMVSEDGEIVWSVSYGPFAEIDKVHKQKVWNPLRLQGQYDDGITGLYYNRYRYYDPKLGSFVSQDPIGLAGGENIYAFGPNVQGWLDPLGLCTKSIPKRNEKTVDLYRAVSPEELSDIMETGQFRTAPNTLTAKQFGRNLDEIVKLADHLPDTAAVVRVKIPESTLKALDNTGVDTFILKSGSVTAHEGNPLKLLNKTIVGKIEHVF